MVHLSIYMDHEGCGATNSNDSRVGGYDQNHISCYEKIYIMLMLYITTWLFLAGNSTNKWFLY